MTNAFLTHLQDELRGIEADGLMKRERLITSPQGAHIEVGGREVLNLCANNYLGLADHPDLIRAAKQAMDDHGYGMASVRFICGTQDLHAQLEERLASFLGTDDAILFAACFDANAAVFEPLLGPEDAIISDSLNHASIIDGIRLCKAKRFRFANSDMDDLEAQLKAAREGGARHVMIATDGVFSMDGYLAKLPEIRALADRYDALLMVDDCHATGFMGPKGAGTPAHFGVRADLLTGTLGKALGGGILPVSMFLARRDVMDVFTPGDHGSTFGGNPLGAAVGLEALNILVEEKLAERSAEMGEYLVQRLREINSPMISEVRGKGLFVGIEIDAQLGSARAVCEALMKRGLLSKETHETVVRLAPPLVISKAEIDWAIAQITVVLSEMDELRLAS